MNEKQVEIDKIIKKTSAKYLKKLEEKDKEINKYKEALETINNSLTDQSQFYTEKEEEPLTDEEIIKKMDEVLQIPKEERQEKDGEFINQYKQQYNDLLFKKEVESAIDWAKENYDGDIKEVLQEEDFIEFASKTNGDLPTLLNKYLNSKQDDKKDIATPGSAKDVSGTASKHYFSKEEVSQMTPLQVKKYLGIIEKSIPKWSK